MKTIYMMPTPSQAANDTSNAINQVVLRLAEHLPAHGWQIIEQADDADLVVGHAGQTDGKSQVDVAHTHGLYPTEREPSKANFAINAHVLYNVRCAYETTAPSQWVAEAFRRDMCFEPTVVGWAINPSEWTSNPDEKDDYVLWNKTRDNGVCDPAPMNELARRLPDVSFVSTFGQDSHNVQIIGRQVYQTMRQYILKADVYLATTRETFGISTLEAMAAGCLILGFDWAGTANIIEHGVTGYLATPGDYDDLERGYHWLQEHADVVRKNAIAAAQAYSWDNVAESFAKVYNRAYEAKNDTRKLSVIIPCYNYAHYVADAIRSVYYQKVDFNFEIVVVNDGSTDNFQDTIDALYEDVGFDKGPRLTIFHKSNGGPASARNAGIEASNSQYILCLDADDQLRHDAPVLQTLVDELDKDRSLGIVYTGLMPIDGDNKMMNPSGWPGKFDFHAQTQRSNQVPTCCMFKREAWVRAGGYRTEFEPAEDAQLWLRIAAIGYGVHQATDAAWFVYRMHDQSLSHNIRIQKQGEPDWLRYDRGWIDNVNRPMAAPPIGDYATNAVRDYDTPDISVIVPCAEYHLDQLPQALESIWSQTFWNWECIVAFDIPESDMSDVFQIVRRFPWIKPIWTGGDRGPGTSRNLAAKKAKGRYLAFLDADDLFQPTFLEKTLRLFHATGRYVYTDWISVGKDGKVETHQCENYSCDGVFKKQSIHSVSVLIPKADFEVVGGFAEDMPAWEDVDFYMKLAAAGMCGVRLAESLLTYRYATGNIREHGETVKGDLKNYLYNKFKQYIEGDMGCGCKEQDNRVQAQMAETDTDVVRVVLNGPKAPQAKMAVVGPSTRQSYGRRQFGDIFLIKREDLPGWDSWVSVFQSFDVAEPQKPLPPAAESVTND